MKRINHVLILLVLAFLFANGCGGGNGTLINLSPGVPPVVIGAITTNQTPHWYAGTAGTLSVASVSGGTTPYIYAWTFSGSALPGGGTSALASPSVTPTAVGTLTASLTVTDSTTPVAKTATASQNFTIETPPFPALTVGTITTSVVGTWNAGVAGTLSSVPAVGGGSGTYTYAWTFSGTANPSPTSSTTATQSVTPAAAGTLHVTLHVADATAAQSVDATPADFTIANVPPPDDTLTVVTDADTYAEGALVKITAHIQGIANNMGQFDAVRLVFTAPASGHYLKFSAAPADAGYKFTLGPNDYSGTNDGIFAAITGNGAAGVVNPRSLNALGAAFLTGSEEGIATLNNQSVTPVGGPADVYDMRDITIIWDAGGATPYPEIVAGSSGDAFTIEQKVQTGASGHDIFIGFIGTDVTLSERTYYSNAATTPAKLKFAGGLGGAGLFGKTIHIS